jgi:transketolase
LAKVGFFPVAHTIAPFIIERSFEQIKLDFCYQMLPGNLVTVGSVFDYSNLGCTHHCYDDFALLKSLPHTQIVYPASCVEFDLLFKQCYDNKLLTLYRMPEYQHEQEIDPSVIEVGKAIKIAEGNDLTVVVTGPQLRNAMQARDELTRKGWATEILYVHTILPLDIEAIRKSVERTKKVLVVEEHNRFGGLGSDILQSIYDIKGLHFSSIAIDSFLHDYGTYDDHCRNLGFSAEGIVANILNNFNK